MLESFSVNSLFVSSSMIPKRQGSNDMAFVLADELPQALTATTETLPATDPHLAVIAWVPCPLVTVPPLGKVQL